MTTQTKQIAVDHLTRLDSGDIAGAAALMAEDCLNHAAIPEAQGRKGFEMIAQKLRNAFPDMRHTIEDVLVDGDKAVLRTTVTGTNTGPIEFIRMPMKATGKPVKFQQIHILRVANGKIVEHWMGQEPVAFFRQLGVQLVPPS
jgi:predicted ester cyclase